MKYKNLWMVVMFFTGQGLCASKGIMKSQTQSSLRLLQAATDSSMSMQALHNEKELGEGIAQVFPEKKPGLLGQLKKQVTRLFQTEDTKHIHYGQAAESILVLDEQIALYQEALKNIQEEIRCLYIKTSEDPKDMLTLDEFANLSWQARLKINASDITIQAAILLFEKRYEAELYSQIIMYFEHIKKLELAKQELVILSRQIKEAAYGSSYAGDMRWKEQVDALKRKRAALLEDINIPAKDKMKAINGMINQLHQEIEEFQIILSMMRTGEFKNESNENLHGKSLVRAAQDKHEELKAKREALMFGN